MNPQHVIVARRSGFEEIFLRRDAFLEQSLRNQAELLRRKHVGTKIQIVAVVVYELERQHDWQKCYLCVRSSPLGAQHPAPTLAKTARLVLPLQNKVWKRQQRAPILRIGAAIEAR